MKTINLYVIKGNICPKCKILSKKCEEINLNEKSDFKVIEIDIGNPKDTDYQLLIENNINSMPVLLVDNDFMEFGDAMKFIKNFDTENREVSQDNINNIDTNSYINVTKYKISTNPNTEEILKSVKENDGYCPCKIEKTIDNKCMCKEFKQMEEGDCHCGLYHKEKLN